LRRRLSYGIHYTFLSCFSSAGRIISYGPAQGLDFLKELM